MKMVGQDSTDRSDAVLFDLMQCEKRDMEFNH